MTDSVEIQVPRENINDEFVTLIKWHLSDGDEVSPDDVIVDVEGSKSVFEISAPTGGFIRLAVAEGEEIAIGATLCRIFESAEAAQAWRSAEDAGSRSAAGGERSPLVRLSRSARALLEERGLDPAAFSGRGLVRAADVLDFLGEGTFRRNESPQPAEAPTAEAKGVLALPGRRAALSPSKRTEGRFIRASSSNTLPSSVTVSVPTRGLKTAVESSEALGGNTTSLIIYEAARLLRKYPLLNACYDDGYAYVYSDVNIGFAVDAGGGLKVPVIRAADMKSPAEITTALRDLLVAYTSNELTAEDQAGGTFTVTDLSTDNVFSFEPLINKGQSAILGVGAELFLPGVREGLFNLTLRFDHQLAEGRLAAAFLNELATRLKGYESAFGVTAQRDADAQHCARCYRNYTELRAANHFLVQCVNADGGPIRICSGCLQGW